MIQRKALVLQDIGDVLIEGQGRVEDYSACAKCQGCHTANVLCHPGGAAFPMPGGPCCPVRMSACGASL